MTLTFKIDCKTSQKRDNSKRPHFNPLSFMKEGERDGIARIYRLLVVLNDVVLVVLNDGLLVVLNGGLLVVLNGGLLVVLNDGLLALLKDWLLEVLKDRLLVSVRKEGLVRLARYLMSGKHLLE